jgi:hypothetical protein
MATFALIESGLNPAGVTALIVKQLFPANPNFHADVDVRDVSTISGVAVGWIVDVDGSIAPYVQPAPTKAALTTYAANARFIKETSGIIVAGAAIATDRDSQAMINGAQAYVTAASVASIAYKTSSGWATLTAAEVLATAVAVGAHVQACFVAESTLDAAITAGTITTTAAIDAAFAAVTV